MKEVELTQGMVAYVDDEDYERVILYTWCANRTHRLHYAITTIDNKAIYLHRFILTPEPHEHIDHIDHNGLNCIRSNMRITTHQMNMINRRTINETGFRGIYKEKRTGRYAAQIKDVDGRRYNLGTFDTPEEAARAYDEAAKQYHGAFAVLNFPV